MNPEPSKSRSFARWLSMSRGIMSMATLVVGGIIGGTWTLATVATTQADRVIHNTAEIKSLNDRSNKIEDRERVLEIALGRIEGKIDSMRDRAH
jgi:hypothetical protein